MTDRKSIIRSVGAYLPARVMTNDDLAKVVDTTDEWIVQRTGIRQRHIAAEGENTSDLATAAGRKALENAGLEASDIDLIVCATTTPDMTFPATAAVVQQKLGIHQGAAFDIQAVCSGFVYAVGTADSYLKNGLAKRVLVIGAETTSRILDWEDRTTCVLFGAGAGAVELGLHLGLRRDDLGIDVGFYSHRERPMTEKLPWDHVNVKKGRAYLEKEQERSVLQLRVMAEAVGEKGCGG